MRRYVWLLSSAMMASTLASCSLEQAIDECMPGARECEEKIFYECLRDGVSRDRVDCGSKGQFCSVENECVGCNEDEDCQSAEKHCIDHRCEPLSVKACIDGETKCEAQKATTCSKKSWINEINCAKGCDTAGTACAAVEGLCKLGETKCDGRTFKTCNDTLDGFNSSICDFTDPYCDDIKGCIKCRDDNDCTKSKPVCNQNTNTCQAANEVCTQGETMCDGKTFKTCNATQSGFDSTSCGLGKPNCVAAKGCVECIANEDCMDAQKTVCNPTTYTCEVPIPVCEKTLRKCEGGVFKECNATQSGFNETVCIAPTPLCSSVNGCVQCRDKNDCKDTTKPVCNSTTYICEAPAPVCAKDEKKCEGGAFKVCNINQSGFDETICGKTAPQCDRSKGCIECRDSFDCGKEKPICNPRTYICQTYAGPCVDGEKTCINEREFSSCSGGKWVSSSCKSDDICDKTRGCVLDTLRNKYAFDSCNFEHPTGYSNGFCFKDGLPPLLFTLGTIANAEESIEGESLKIDALGLITITAPTGIGHFYLNIKKLGNQKPGFLVSVNKKVVFSGENVEVGVTEYFNTSVNVSGSVEITIGSIEPLVIDNLQWTNYP